MAPRPRFRKLALEKKKSILQEAAQEFALRGFDGASLNRIIANSGMSKGAFYYYFDDKLDLLLTAMEDLDSRVRESIDFHLEELNAENYWTRYAEYGAAIMALAEAEPWLASLMGAVYTLSPGREELLALEHWFAEHATWGLATIERGQELGAVRVDLPSALLFEMMLGVQQAGDRWLIQHWDSEDAANLEVAAAAMMQMIIRLLSPPDSM